MPRTRTPVERVMTNHYVTLHAVFRYWQNVDLYDSVHFGAQHLHLRQAYSVSSTGFTTFVTSCRAMVGSMLVVNLCIERILTACKVRTYLGAHQIRTSEKPPHR